MILIADSGSTKTAWIFTDGNHKEQFTTGGANPFFRSTDNMVSEWKDSPVGNLKGKVSQINFYAAGVVNKEKADIIKHALLVFFPKAVVSVESDLLAAAHATLGNSKGIVCILGTGSNSCQFDGKQITDQIPPLGFILGDEGSGAVLGRQVIGDYLKKQCRNHCGRFSMINIRMNMEKFSTVYTGMKNQICFLLPLCRLLKKTLKMNTVPIL